MSAIFGTYTNAKLFVPGGSASWSIGDDIAQARQYDNALLLSFALVDQETIDIKRCFEETTHIFAYGRNMNTSVLQVSLLIFLYNGCKTGGPAGSWLKLEDLRTAYDRNRIYKKKEAIKVVIDDFNMNGYLIKMDISDVNPVNKTCVATFTFIPDQEV